MDEPIENVLCLTAGMFATNFKSVFLRRRIACSNGLKPAGLHSGGTKLADSMIGFERRRPGTTAAHWNRRVNL